MAKHLSFWIGFFVASLLIVPVAVGVWGVVEDKILDWVAVLFGAVSSLILLLIFLLFFKEQIQRKIFSSAESSIDEVRQQLVETISAAVERDSEGIIAAGDKLTSNLVAWYAWSNLYRWVIGTAIALLVSLGAFAGTVLLFEQTRTLRQQTIALNSQSETLKRQTDVLQEQTVRLGEQTEFMKSQTSLMEAQTESLEEQRRQGEVQNAIAGLNLVELLRAQLLVSSERRNLHEHATAAGVPSSEEAGMLFGLTGGASSPNVYECSVHLNPSHLLYIQPSEATIANMESLAREPVLGDRIVEALRFLAQDNNGAVAFAAIRILDKLGKDVTHRVLIRDLYLDGFHSLDGAHDLFFVSSYISGLGCVNCKMSGRGSVFVPSERLVLEPVSSANVLVDLDSKSPTLLHGMLVKSKSDSDPNGAVELAVGDFWGPKKKSWLIETGFQRTQDCESMKAIASGSQLFEFRRED